MTFQAIPIPLSLREAHPARRQDAAIVDPRTHIEEHLRPMRAFARCLTRDSARGDTLVYDTVVKAWASIDTFEPGADVGAWLFSMERDIFYAQRRKTAGRERLAAAPDHEDVAMMAEFRRAFDSLSDEDREALTLVGAAGFSHKEAADICGCPIGTLSTRANRGRRRLSKILFPTPVEDRSRFALIGAIGQNP